MQASSAIATRILDAHTHKKLHRLEDGPTGGTPIVLGNEMIGQAIDAPIKGGWNLARVRDFSLAQSAYQLTRGNLWLPGLKKSEVQKIPITKIGEIAKIGPYHADICGHSSTGGIRGPFEKQLVQSNSVPTYPLLWEHEAEREYSMTFECDHEAIPLIGDDDDEQEIIDKKVMNVWATASHCHFNVNFQFNSQATSMQYTKRLTIGGRAWLSIKLKSDQLEKALVLWANTSLGLLLHWWMANRQQIGRGNIGKSVLEILPTLGLNQLTEKQLTIAEGLFDEYALLPMRPINEIAQDQVRRALDLAVTTKFLGLPESLCSPDGPLELLRMKLGNEPSVTGHKAH